MRRTWPLAQFSCFGGAVLPLDSLPELYYFHIFWNIWIGSSSNTNLSYRTDLVTTMPFQYKRKKESHGTTSADVMAQAVKKVLNGAKIREMAKTFNIPRGTLQRYIKKARKEGPTRPLQVCTQLPTSNGFYWKARKRAGRLYWNSLSYASWADHRRNKTICLCLLGIQKRV